MSSKHRLSSDRRMRPTPFLSKWSFSGGRRETGGRREGENVRAYVDIYSLRAWIVLTAFFFLSFLDAHFTLLHLMRGGGEANFFVRKILDLGPGPFLAIKQIGIGVGAALFCVLKNHPNARLGVLLAMTFYQALLVYHLLLFFRIGSLGVSPNG